MTVRSYIAVLIAWSLFVALEFVTWINVLAGKCPLAIRPKANGVAATIETAAVVVCQSAPVLVGASFLLRLGAFRHLEAATARFWCLTGAWWLLPAGLCWTHFRYLEFSPLASLPWIRKMSEYDITDLKTGFLVETIAWVGFLALMILFQI